MDLGNGLGHLTYSTLVHPGDTWDDMWSSLTTYVPQVKAARCAERALRRLPAAVRSVRAHPGDDPVERDRLRSFLADNDLYLYTVERLSVRAVQGHASSRSRSTSRTGARRSARSYTIDVADVLADVVDGRHPPSIQTAPLGFKPNVTGPDVVASYTEHVLHVAAHLVELEQRTGRTVTLAIEPEPLLLPRDHRRDGRVLRAAPLLGRRQRPSSPGSRGSRSPRPTSPFAATSASCSTSATRRSSTRTSRLAADAGRRRHPDLQAAGGGSAARSRR